MKTQWLKFADERRTGLFFAVGVNLLAMAAMVCLMRPSFETNDDIVFAELGSGLRGVKDAHFVFQNYILGLICRFLYQVTGRLPWYTILQYAVLLTAFSAVTYVLMNRLEGYSGLYLSLVFLCCFGYEAYIHIQFTKTGGIAAAAAVFLLLHVIDREKFSVWEFFWGIGLGLLGFMYREDQFWASSALMAGSGLCFLLTLKKRYPGRALKKLAVCAGSFLVLLLSVAVAGGFDSYMYSGEEWRQYQEFNDLRSKLLDYGFPDYDSSREVYQELGITREAYELYKTWNFNDPEKFTAEMMERLVEEKAGRTFHWGQVLNFLKRFPSDLSKLPMAFFGAAFLLLWLIFGRKNFAAVFSIIFEGFLICVLYFYLYYQGRYMVNRVDVGLWCSVCLVILWMISERALPTASPESGKSERELLTASSESGKSERELPGDSLKAVKSERKLPTERPETGRHEDVRPRLALPGAAGLSGKAGIFLCAAALLCSQFLWHRDWRISTGSIPEARVSQRAVLETIGTDKEHVYLAKSGTVSEIVCYGPFDPMPENLLDNLYWFGGWECRTPGFTEEMETHGIVNPYRDVIDNDKVYLIDNNIELTIAYIRQYYDEDAEAVFVRTLGNVALYQIKG